MPLYSNQLTKNKAVYDEALDVLTCTAWDGDLQEAKTARSALAKLLGVSVPAPPPTKAEAGAGGAGGGDATPAGGGQARKPDEMESYESLVRTVGY